MDVSDGFFEILGAKPIIGRLFTPEEDRPGARGWRYSAKGCGGGGTAPRFHTIC